MASVPQLQPIPHAFPVPRVPAPQGEQEHYGGHQLFDLLGSNGWHGINLLIAGAIAWAESGGDPKAKHTNTDGSIDRGLFQINSRAHPEVPDSCAFDPRCASRAANRIAKGGKDFTPWSTYNSGAYKKYLPKVTTGGVQGGFLDVVPGGETAKGAGEALGDAAKAVANAPMQLFNLITSLEFWLRLGEGIAGLILIAMGLKALTGVTIPLPPVVPV